MNLWNFLRRKGKGAAIVEAPATPVVSAPPPVSAASEAPPPPVAEAPVARLKPQEPPLPLSELELPAPIADALALAMRRGAHALLTDPEEFACLLCSIGDGAIEAVAECPLEVYEQAHRAIQLLDRQRVESEGRTAYLQLFNALTDLGRRTVIQIFDPSWDDEALTERRKANVRLINRLRPGTSLTRHNRTRLIAAVKRAGERPGPPFLARLHAASLLPPDAPSDDAALEEVVRTAVLPRKAVARVLGEYLDLPFVDVEENLPRAHARLFEREQILEWEAIPCGSTEEAVQVAMADPTDVDAIEKMRVHLGRPVVVQVAAATDIRVATDKLFRT